MPTKRVPLSGVFGGRSPFDEFCRFARAQVDANDIDSEFFLLLKLYDADGLDDEHRPWRSLLYVTFYHLGSAEGAWQV